MINPYKRKRPATKEECHVIDEKEKEAEASSPLATAAAGTVIGQSRIVDASSGAGNSLSLEQHQCRIWDASANEWFASTDKVTPNGQATLSPKVSFNSLERNVDQRLAAGVAENESRPNPYKRKTPGIDNFTKEETNETDASALVIAAADKAGMEGIDRSRIDAIILRESGNSLFIQQQKRRDEKVNERIVSMKANLNQQIAMNPNWQARILPEIDRTLRECITKRPDRSTCVVVDMDMFYMACELLTRPELKDKPACVGGGMILTSNYPARKFGVRSAMAGWIGDALVKELTEGKEELIHVKADHKKYAQQSQVIRSVLAEYDPHLRAYSLDEAFMNLGPYLACHLLHPEWSHEEISKTLLEGEIQGAGDVMHSNGESFDNLPDDFSLHSDSESKIPVLETLARYSNIICLEEAGTILADMRQRVCDRTGGLTCSAGLAPNFMLAKIASDRNKPNGQCLVASDQDSVRDFLYPLATRKVSGIGRVTEKFLRAFDINTVEQMYEQRALVKQIFTPAQANFLLRASVGCSSSDGFLEEEQDISNSKGQKGISRERTFRPGQAWNEINARLEDVGRLLSSDMERKGFWAHTITVKVKLHTFDVLSRARSLKRGVFVQSADDLIRHSTELLAEVRQEFAANPQHRSKAFSVRLLGIRCSNFRHEQDSDSTGCDQSNLDQFFLPRSNSPVPTIAEASEGTSPARVSFDRSFPPEREDTMHHDEPRLVFDEVNDRNANASKRKQGIVVTPQNSSLFNSCEPVAAEVACPVCGLLLPEDDNLFVNQHIDTCLSGAAVREAVRETSRTVRKGNPKSHLDYYFSASAKSRKGTL